jgi:tetratricopeptide (TPR) repeat protein
MAVLVLAVGLGGACLWWVWSWLAPSPVARGVLAYNRGDWSEAARLAQERLAAAPDDPRALRLLARSAVRLGRFPVARALYDRLGAQDLEAEDYCVLGLGWNVSGEPLEAEKALQAALQADPDHAESLHLLGLATFQRAQWIEATRAAERLARRPGWEARADLLLGMIRAADNDPGGAGAALRRALERDPAIRLTPSDPFSTQKLLARSLLRAGRPAEARDALRRALDSGADREAQWLSSRAALQEGHPAEAAAALARSGSYRAEHPLEPEPAPYVGAAQCAGCHPKPSQAVLASRHARTFRNGRDLAEIPLPDRPLLDPDNPQVSHTLKRSSGQVQVETRVSDRVLRAVVDYALGSSNRYISLVGRDEHGQARTLRLSYHRTAEGSGWDRSKGQAVHPVRIDDYLGERFRSEDEQRECLVCHTTSARATREQAGPVAGDRAIGCERCHGPGGHHRAAVAAKFPESAIASPAQASPAEINQSCGDCHSQHFLAMPAARTAPDWTRFPGSTLPWSRCYTESGGALNCVTCHDPHQDAETSPSYYEAKCLSCHATTSAQGQPAPVRSPGGEAAFRSPCPVNPRQGCLDCHMPKVRYDWLHGDFTDHDIRVHRPSDAGH